MQYRRSFVGVPLPGPRVQVPRRKSPTALPVEHATGRGYGGKDDEDIRDEQLVGVELLMSLVEDVGGEGFFGQTKKSGGDGEFELCDRRCSCALKSLILYDFV